MQVKCSREHDIYVAEVIGVEKEGKIVVITVCRGCDSVSFHEKTITSADVPLRMIKEEKQNGTV